MPSKFKAPADEQDRRLLARELFVKGKTSEEIAEVTNLPPETINKIVQWLKSDQGQVWIKRHYPEGVQSQPAQAEAPAAEQPSQESPRGAAQPPPGVPPLSQVAPGMQAKVQSTGGPAPPPTPKGPNVTLTPEQFAALLEKGAGGPLPTESDHQEVVTGSGVLLRESTIREDNPALTGRYTQTFVKPWTVIWFMRMVSMGYKRDMATFIEECVTGHMREKYGLSYAMVREE